MDRNQAAGDLAPSQAATAHLSLRGVTRVYGAKGRQGALHHTR